jgi:hypothetical protein
MKNIEDIKPHGGIMQYSKGTRIQRLTDAKSGEERYNGEALHRTAHAVIARHRLRVLATKIGGSLFVYRIRGRTVQVAEVGDDWNLYGQYGGRVGQNWTLSLTHTHTHTHTD